MAVSIRLGFTPRIGGGGTVTVAGEVPSQAFYWELVSYDPETETEGAPLGSLKYVYTKTNAASLAVNIYYAPTDPLLTGMIDRIKVRWANA